MFAKLPDGAPRRILNSDAIEDLEDLHFVHSLNGPHVALTSMNGECVVVDISSDAPRILARVGA